MSPALRNVIAFTFGLLVMFVLATSVFAGEYQTKYVPDGKKLVLVPERVNRCVVHVNIPLKEAKDDQPSNGGGDSSQDRCTKLGGPDCPK